MKQAEAGELLLSDSMPWRELAHEDVFYLPKPCAVSEKKQEVPADLRKKMKRLSWIPVSDMGRFEQSIRGDALYKPKDEAFGIASERTSVSIAEGRGCDALSGRLVQILSRLRAVYSSSAFADGSAGRANETG